MGAAATSGRPARRLLLTLEAMDMSGVAFATQNLLTGLLRRGAQAFLLARAGGDREPMFAHLGIRRLAARHFGTPWLGRRALVAARDFGPEAILAQCPAVARRSYRLARALGVPLVVTVNRLDLTEGAWLAARPDVGVIAVSDAIASRLAGEEKIPADRIRVIPNGLDIAQFPRPAFDAPPARGSVPVVGTYGTLAERKGQRVFLRAAAEVLRRRIDAEFLIMGHGPDKATLRGIAEDLGIGRRVTFSPSTSTDIRTIANIDLLVEPTFQEGLGLSVLQAMAAGVPVVASGVGGLSTLVRDGETGILVPSGDASALAEAVGRLLADPNRRLELARSARERVEREFSAEAVAERCLAFCGERRAEAGR